MPDVSIPPICPTTPTELALLFLTRGDPHQSAVWAGFIEEAAEAPRVFVHAKEPDALRSAIFTRATRVPTVPTGWADVSLVRATLRLLRAALSESDASHFALVSESCVPIKPLREMLRRLAMDGRSRIDWMPPARMSKPHNDRFRQSVGIAPEQWRVHPQWMILSREAADWVISEDLTRCFESVFAPDEHYIGTVLEMMGYPLERVRQQASTWVSWGTGAPNKWIGTDGSLALELAESTCFFARKFTAESDIGKWRLHSEGAAMLPPKGHPPDPLPKRKKLRPREIRVNHDGWRDSLVFMPDGGFSRKETSCSGTLVRDGHGKILNWRLWAPERLIRHPDGPGAEWWIVPMDWRGPPPARSIFVRANGGIGNQLFQLAYGLHLQRKFGGELSGNLTLLRGIEGIPKTLTREMDAPDHPRVRECDDAMAEGILGSPVHPGIVLTGIFQQYLHFEQIRDLLCGMLGSVEKSDAIGVHFRRGDYLRSGHYMNLTASYYEIGVRLIMERHPRNYREIVIFSDDVDWCASEIQPVLERILPASIFRGDARATLGAMKGMRGMVIPNSTFGWWGAWLADCPTVHPAEWKIPGGRLRTGLGCELPYWHAVETTAVADPADGELPTIVSAFFDIGTFQKGNEGLRSAATYRAWMRNLDRLVNPIIFFVESEEDYNWLHDLRAARGLPTRVVMIDRSRMRAFRHCELVAASILKAAFKTSPPNTTLAEYSCVTHAKFELVSESVARGWVETTDCCWMDCGKALEALSMAAEKHYRISRLSGAGDLIHFGEAQPFVHKSLAEIQTAQAGAGDYSAAGAFFYGEKHAMASWCENYLEHALEYQKDGWVLTDQANLCAMLSEGHADKLRTHRFPDPWFGLCKHLLGECTGNTEG